MKLFIANRGEIARRIIKTAKRMKISTAVAYSDSDKELPFVKEADEKKPLHGEEPRETYLDIKKIISAAKEMGATHIHPGYGFLSEKEEFVEAVLSADLNFIGPPASCMRLLGDKAKSRAFLKQNNVPLLPSYAEDDQSDTRLMEEGLRLGFPLIVKPAAGGGGKGMSLVFKKEELREAISSSQRVASGAFKDSRLLLERYIPSARHIEVQILADKFGQAKAIGERECSLQRKHQKVIEEAPCQFLSQKLRDRIYQASEKLARAAGYQSAGTVEWIWDGEEGIYFLEVNTRLQVEHGVTELVTGLDLVEWQLRIALGESLSRMPPFKTFGHAIEARICAEDPLEQFMPSTGKIHRLKLPSDIRVDFGFEEKNNVSPYFDSMIGKFMSFGETREDARMRLVKSLEDFICFGPTTNRSFCKQLLEADFFINGKMTTQTLNHFNLQFDWGRALDLLKQEGPNDQDEDLDWYSPFGFITKEDSSIVSEDFEGMRYFHTPFDDWKETLKSGKKKKSLDAAQETSGEIRSPLPAKINKVSVTENQSVKKGDLLLILEAMKMEHQLKAPRDGHIKELTVIEGQRVELGALLLKVVS